MIELEDRSERSIRESLDAIRQDQNNLINKLQEVIESGRLEAVRLADRLKALQAKYDTLLNQHSVLATEHEKLKKERMDDFAWLKYCAERDAYKRAAQEGTAAHFKAKAERRKYLALRVYVRGYINHGDVHLKTFDSLMKDKKKK